MCSSDLPNNATNVKATALMKSSFDAAGIKAKFNMIETGVYYPTVQDVNKQNDISRSGWGADWANASTVIPPLFIKDGGFDLSGNWKEAGYADFEAVGWIGIAAPAKTPAPILDKLNAEMIRIINDPEVKERLATLAFTPEIGRAHV